MNNNLFAKKSLGQNFLKSKKAIHQMITAVETTEKDLVIEIGPGKGALTKPILETGARVIAFELDERMIEYLNQELSEYIENKKLILVHKDVLDINMKVFFKPLGAYKVIANIPYYITNAIIRKFLDTDFQPTDMSLLMQKEVAERIVSRNNKHSLLSLSVAVFGSAKYVSKVSRKYFSPSPKVDSAIIHIKNISHNFFTQKKQEDLFFKLIHAGFSHKRKRFGKNLQSLLKKEQIDSLFKKLNLDINIRAEDINLDLWKKITQETEIFLEK